ncbi:DUF2461 domain-containing protein [soil metagenome]
MPGQPSTHARARFEGFDPAALQFLADLADNNSRDWFKPRKADYDRLVKAPMEALCVALAERFGALDLPLRADPAKSLFRIYRDTRFSKDKTPYKTWQGASFPWVGERSESGEGSEGGRGTEGGRGGPGGVGGYFHLAPGDLFLGGGMWHPGKERLAAFRALIDRDPSAVFKAVEDDRFASVFESVTGDRLTRNPQGYAKDHPYSSYLRLKDVVFMRRLSDDDVASPELPDLIARDLDAARPVFRLLASL